MERQKHLHAKMYKRVLSARSFGVFMGALNISAAERVAGATLFYMRY
jgi:hypothetical protein